MSKQIVVGAALVLAGCWTSTTTPGTTPVVGTAGGSGGGAPMMAAGGEVMTDTAVGAMPANIAVSMLGAKMPGYTLVKAMDAAFPDFSEGEHVNVMKGTERMYVIVTHGDEVFNVHTDNPKIGVAGHPSWHVGATFAESAALSRCECWGGNNVCWKDGEHAALAFERSCSSTVDDASSLRVMNGLVIKRMVWNPKPFGPDKDEPAHSPNNGGAGGGLTGKVHIHPDNGGAGNGGGGDDDDDGGGGGGGDDDDGD